MSGADAGSRSARDRERLARVAELRSGGAASIPDLVTELAGTTWVVRRAVVAALAEADATAMSALCEALRTARADEGQVAGIVDALSLTKNAVDEAVLELTADANQAVMCDAAQILGRRESVRAVPRLTELLVHPNDNVCLAAVEALGRIGHRDALEPLLRLAESGNFFRVFPTIDVLGRCADSRALPTLLKLAGDPLYAIEAVRALGRLGDPTAVPALLQLASGASETLVRATAAALIAICESSQQRFGTAVAIERALLALPRLGELSRQLTVSLKRADATEQIAVTRMLAIIGTEDVVPALLAQLDGAPAVAQVAAGSLKKLVNVAESTLIEALRAGTSAQRRLLVPVLSGRLAARDELIDALEDEDAMVRALACEALARTSDPSAVPQLFRLLGDADARVAQAALGAIQALGGDETKRLALDAAKSQDTRLRRAGLRIIGYFGYPDALDTLAQATQADDERVRDAAIAGLPFVEDPRALELLLAAASSPAAGTRVSAVRALAHANGEPNVRRQLRSCLTDSDPWVRYYACLALGRLKDESAAEAIAALLSDDSGQVRVAAVDALAHLPGARAFELLCQALASEDADLNRAALVGLGLSKRAEALPKLLAALSAPEPSTRLVALSALAELGLRQAVPAIARATEDPDAGVRAAAAGFLAARTDADATNELLALLVKQPSRQSLIEALSRPAPGRVESIVAALASADDALAGALVTSLARTRSEAALVGIRATFESANDAARRAAASALVAMQDSASTSAVRHAALSDPDAEVRRICSTSLLSP